MSKFSGYASEARVIIMNAFSEYREAKDAFTTAQKTLENTHPIRFNDPPDVAKLRRKAEWDYDEASDRMREAQKQLEKRLGDLRGVRERLLKAVNGEYAANPEDIDQNTLELLKSGIMNINDYDRLFNAAVGNENHTMTRLIGTYAGKAAETATQSDEAQFLREIEYRSREHNGSDVLAKYDAVLDVFGRCTRNDAMISHFDELCGSILDNF